MLALTNHGIFSFFPLFISKKMKLSLTRKIKKIKRQLMGREYKLFCASSWFQVSWNIVGKKKSICPKG
jgi:hypothetical protein